MQKRYLALSSILLLFGYIAVGCSSNTGTQGVAHSMPAPIVWDFYHDQTYVHNANNEQVAYFRPTASTQPPSQRTYIFIRMNSSTVTTITKEQYLAIAGSMNFQE